MKTIIATLLKPKSKEEVYDDAVKVLSEMISAEKDDDDGPKDGPAWDLSGKSIKPHKKYAKQTKQPVEKGK